jgi:hypothetical protein
MEHDASSSSSSQAASSPPESVPIAVMQQMQAHMHYLQQQVQAQQAQMQHAAEQAAVQAAAHLQQVGSGAVGRSLPKMRQPSLFRGQVGQSVDAWVSELKQQFAYYGRAFEDEANRVRFAVAHLAPGTAALLWWEAEPNKEQVTTFEAFVERLHTRFRPVQAAMLARQQLGKLKQGPREAASGFASRFQSTLAPITDMSAADQVHHFVTALQPHIGKEVLSKLPTTLAEAIEHAVLFETRSNLGRSGLVAFPSRMQSGGYSTSAHASSSVPMDVNNVEEHEAADEHGPSEPSAPAASATSDAPLRLLMAKLQSMEQRISAMAPGGQSRSGAQRRNGNGRSERVPGLRPGEIDRRRAERLCFRCGEPGHQKADCQQGRSHF